MSERVAGEEPEALPRPTPRQLVIRAIGTALVIGAMVVAGLVIRDARDDPAGVTSLAQDPRTVSYGRLSLQIPADWELGDVDECGHVQGDTLILGLSGTVTCEEGNRDPEASAIVMSSMTGRMVAPAPEVRMRPVTLPTGLRAERGSTLVAPPFDPDVTGDRADATDDGNEGGDDGGIGDGGSGDGGGDNESGGNEDETPLRTTVLRIPSLNAQVVATSPDRQLVRGILNSAKRVPDDSRATPSVAFLFAALDTPPTWEANAIECGTPITNTVVAGHPSPPALTADPDAACPSGRPAGVTDIYLEALDSAYGRRWGVIANDPVTLLGGVKGLRGTREQPDGLTVTVVVVSELRAIAVARSTDQPLVNMVLSTMRRAVPTPIAEDESTPTRTPEPTSRPTLPAGVKTRTVRYDGLAVSVPTTWRDGAVRCGIPQRNTVVLGAPAIDGPGCNETRPPGVSALVIDRLYSAYGSLWQAAATDPITLPSGLSGLRGSVIGADGLPVTVLAFPTIDAIIVATAADEGDAQALIDGILTTARAHQ